MTIFAENLKDMNDNITLKNREKWSSYAEHLRDISYILRDMRQVENSDKLLLNSVEFFKEVREIEDKVSPVNELWNNIDTSNIKIGGFYKEVRKLSYYHNQIFVNLYHVLGFAEDSNEFVVVEEIEIMPNRISIRQNQDGQLSTDRLSGKNFSLKISDGIIKECPDSEWHQTIEMNNKLNQFYNDSKK